MTDHREVQCSTHSAGNNDNKATTLKHAAHKLAQSLASLVDCVREDGRSRFELRQMSTNTNAMKNYLQVKLTMHCNYAKLDRTTLLSYRGRPKRPGTSGDS